MPPERDPNRKPVTDVLGEFFPDDEPDTQSMSRAPLVAYYLAHGVPPQEVDGRVDSMLKEHAAQRAQDQTAEGAAVRGASRPKD